MSERLAGKVSVITGAGQGIGRAAALAFATAGSTVWAVDRNAAALDTLQAEQPLIETKVLDVTDGPDITRFARGSGHDRRAVQLRRLRAHRQHPRLHRIRLGRRHERERHDRCSS